MKDDVKKNLITKIVSRAMETCRDIEYKFDGDSAGLAEALNLELDLAVEQICDLMDTIN